MLPSLLETEQTVKMLAILKQWDQTSGSYTDNTHNYFLLLFSKTAMDTVAFLLCSRKRCRSLLGACSLSVLLADWVLLLSVSVLWLFLKPGGSSGSLCFVLSHASAAFTALPLPMMSLGLLDYCLEDSCHQRTFWKLLRNVLLTLLVWTLAVSYSFHTVSAKPMRLMEETGMTVALGCEVGESSLTTYFILLLFGALLLATLPFWSRIPQWVMEAERLADARTENESKKSDLMFTSSYRMETESREEKHLEEKHLEEKHLEEKHLEEEHLEWNHLEEEHLEWNHLEEKHLEWNHLEEEHLEEKHLEWNHLEEEHLEEEHLEWNHLEEEHLEEKYLEENHLEEKHLEEKHLEEKHLEWNHLEEKHLEENHLEEKHLQEKHLEDSIRDRPPLWFSLTLGFGLLWMPYIATCVVCILSGIAVPAYISVNLLWLECTNSLLVGLVFWMRSETRGPYSRLPENVCLWNVYWHLSRTEQHKQLPVTVFNPSKTTRKSYFYV